MNNILITGAASGIGAATARQFHARGWQVGLLDIDQPRLVALSGELDGAWFAAVDVNDATAVHAALESFCALSGGRLRLLFNSAGVLRFGYFEELSLQEHARILQINILGLLQVIHTAFPFLKGNPDAQVINMGSASGVYGTPHMVSYSASKFAVRGLTEGLELEWRRHGIRVGDLMPPFVRTPMVGAQHFDAPAFRRLGVKLQAEDIAAAAWHQANRAKVHRPIHWLFRLLYSSGQVLPNRVNRAVMGWLSRE